MIYKSLLITTLIVSSSFSLGLDDTSKKSNKKLSLKKVINLSLKNDPWLLGNKYSQQAIESKSISARTYADPKITIGAVNLPTDSFDFNQEAMTQLKVGVSQMFPRGDSLEIKHKQLKLEASQYPFQREDRKGWLMVNVSQLWFDAYLAQESIHLIQKDRSLFEQLVDVAESSYSSTIGKTRQQDIISAQLQLTKLDDRLTRLKQKKDKFLFSLSQWLYTYSNEEQLNDTISKSFNLVLPNKLPSIKLLNSDAFNHNVDSKILIDTFKNHPSIKNIEQKIKAATKNISLAKQKYKPQFGVNTSYSLRDDDIKGNSRADLFSVGFSFDVPLFTKNKQDQDLQAAVLKTKFIRTQKLLQLRKLLSSFETTKSNLKNLNDRDTLYLSKLLPQLSEHAETTLTAYTNDDGAFSEVVKSRIAQLNTKIDALNIKVEIQKNIIKLNYYFMTKSDDIFENSHFNGDNL